MRDKIDEYIDEMKAAQENEDDASIRLYLLDGEYLEIWFDKANDYYLWSNASFGYEDICSVVDDIFEWLEENSLTVEDIEMI